MKPLAALGGTPADVVDPLLSRVGEASLSLGEVEAAPCFRLVKWGLVWGCNTKIKFTQAGARLVKKILVR